MGAISSDVTPGAIEAVLEELSDGDITLDRLIELAKKAFGNARKVRNAFVFTTPFEDDPAFALPDGPGARLLPEHIRRFEGLLNRLKDGR